MADDPLYQRFGKEFSAGTRLFSEGEPGAEMFVVQSGLVRISVRVRGVEKVLVDLGAGEFFGEMSILNDRPRSATATVVKDAQLLVIDPQTFEAMVRGSDEIAIRMIKKLASRLQRADEQIANLLLRDCSSRVVHALLSLSADQPPEEGGVCLQLDAAELSGKIGVDERQVEEVLARLVRAGLLVHDEDALILPSPDRLQEFLGVLSMKERIV